MLGKRRASGAIPRLGEGFPEVCTQAHIAESPLTSFQRKMNIPVCGDPDVTDSRYCIYDAVHNDYVYTQAWIDKLIAELTPATQTGI